MRWTTIVLASLAAALAAAPGAYAISGPDKQTPSSDTPWLIGLLVVVVVLLGVGALWFLRSNMKARGSSHFKD